MAGGADGGGKVVAYCCSLLNFSKLSGNELQPRLTQDRANVVNLLLLIVGLADLRQVVLVVYVCV